MTTNILLVTSNFFLFCSKKVGKQSVPRLCKKFDSKERDKEREREREREREIERDHKALLIVSYTMHSFLI